MGIILGLAAALLYGGCDFGGGLLSRRLGSVRERGPAETRAGQGSFCSPAPLSR